MPLNKYFGGHGDQVMRDMTSRYGSKKGERVFYATANARHQKPRESRGRSRRAL